MLATRLPKYIVVWVGDIPHSHCSEEIYLDTRPVLADQPARPGASPAALTVPAAVVGEGKSLTGRSWRPSVAQCGSPRRPPHKADRKLAGCSVVTADPRHSGPYPRRWEPLG